MPNGWRTINSLVVHKIRLHGRRGKGMAESFSRQKSRHAPQKEGELKILCDLPPVWPRLVRPTNLMSRMDGKKTHTHTHTVVQYIVNAASTTRFCTYGARHITIMQSAPSMKDVGVSSASCSLEGEREAGVLTRDLQQKQWSATKRIWLSFETVWRIVIF